MKMKAISQTHVTFGMRFLLTVFYLLAGILHLVSPSGFVRIVPAFLPWPQFIVLFTGLCEIAGAVGLMVRGLRHAAGIGLAAYAVCVFPANVNHAVNMISVGGLPDTWWYHAPRLAFQPVLVWWALYCSGVTTWPFSREK
jgi:uncharacterized membrane protein